MSPPYYRGPASDHFDGQRFFNRFGPTVDRPLADIWRWKRAGTSVPWSANASEVLTDRPPPRVDGLRVAMVGHASLLIQVAGRNVLVDPVWSDRASPVRFLGPRRFNAPGIRFEDLPSIDAVLLTHSHYDHMDAATLRRLWAVHRPRIIAPLGNDVVLRRAVPELRVEARDWDDECGIAPGLTAVLTPANHWSSRTGTDRRRALWCGYMLRSDWGSAYIAGDTGWGDGTLFAAIRRRHGAPRLAILPIGAYEPRWFMADQHMNPAEAVQALISCGATQGLGVHWGTFKLTDEAQEAPAEALDAALAAASLPPERFVAMRPGTVWQSGE